MTEPTEEMIKNEIREAVKILRDDGMHITKHVRKLFEEMQTAKTEPAKPDEPATDPALPPVTENKPAPTRVSLWWGTREL